MAIELKHVRNDEPNGSVMGSVFIDVCHEFGSDADTKLKAIKAILEKS